MEPDTGWRERVAEGDATSVVLTLLPTASGDSTAIGADGAIYVETAPAVWQRLPLEPATPGAPGVAPPRLPTLAVSPSGVAVCDPGSDGFDQCRFVPR